MKTYTVYEAADAPADSLDRAEGLVFVRDGFVWSAALFMPLWAIANRLWLVLIGYLVTVAAIYLAVSAFGGADAIASTAIMALHFVLGFEASSLRRWTLARHGWQYLGSVTGRSGEDCERRFFEAWLPSQPLIRTETLANSSLTDNFDLRGSGDVVRRWLPSLHRYRLARR
jgi:Protein of unknown function (DUF2628)